MLKTIFTIFIIISALTIVKAQDSMGPPPPVENSDYEAMVGDWTADATMMGMPFISNLKVSWDLNHQFLVFDLVSTNKANPSIGYQGKGMFGIDSKGNAKVWWFDSWGAAAVATSTGFFNGGVLTLTGGNDMYKDTRTFEVDGNTMTMRSVGTMVSSGKDVPFDETTVFMKKN